MRQELGRCRLDDILDEVGWTQQMLCDYAEISKSTVSRYASGEREMSLYFALKICDAIYIKKGIVVHPRELYEGTRKGPTRRNGGVS